MKKNFIVGFMMVMSVLVLPVFAKAENVSTSPSGSAAVNPNTSAENLMISSQQQLSRLMEQIQKLQAELSRLQGEVKKVGEQIEKLTKSLKLGAEGKEVETLQKFLKQDPGIYPEGKVTGYYGSLTEKAVKKFQQKNGIESVGTVGPITMTKINEIIGGNNKEDSKITICHIPPENTTNRQTITISKSAWEAHKVHGDTENTCVSTQPTTPGACTTDTKLCSNGSYVSRTGPNCEFAACPISQYYINVVSPNGGETWTTGSSQYIKWSSSLPSAHKIITVRLRDSASREYYLLSDTPNDGIEQITVPATLVAGLYTLEIKTFLENQTVFDKSDAAFNIVLSTPTPIFCSESWSCGGWSSCINSMQTRTCTDTNNCSISNARPVLSQSCTPTPVTISLPAPTGLKVGFGIGSGVNNWVKAEESLSFNFDVGSLSNVSAFRLYQKKPQDLAFSIVGEFSNPSSLNLCYLKRTYGTWDLAPIGGPSCPGSAWHISRTSLYPVSSYTVGDYLYYVTALDASGTEGPSSITGKSTFLGTFPITVETSGTLNPTFGWQAVSGWSQPLAYWVMVASSDGTGSQQMLTAVTSAGPSISKVYDGTALIPDKEYSAWAYGRSHNSDQSEDRMSFASEIATFKVSASTTATTQSANNQMANVLEAMREILNQLQELLKNR